MSIAHTGSGAMGRATGGAMGGVIGRRLAQAGRDITFVISGNTFRRSNRMASVVL